MRVSGRDCRTRAPAQPKTPQQGLIMAMGLPIYGAQEHQNDRITPPSPQTPRPPATAPRQPEGQPKIKFPISESWLQEAFVSLAAPRGSAGASRVLVVLCYLPALTRFGKALLGIGKQFFADCFPDMERIYFHDGTWRTRTSKAMRQEHRPG